MSRGCHFQAGQRPGEQQVPLQQEGKGHTASLRDLSGPTGEAIRGANSNAHVSWSQEPASLQPLPGHHRPPGHFPSSPDFSLPTAGTHSDETDLRFIPREVRRRRTWGVYACSQAWRKSSSGDRAHSRCGQEQASATSLGLGTREVRGGQGRAEPRSGCLLGHDMHSIRTHTLPALGSQRLGHKGNTKHHIGEVKGMLVDYLLEEPPPTEYLLICQAWCQVLWQIMAGFCFL